jgi:hypothetical protein
MNIYRINIWGPSPNESAVLARRSGALDNTAVVFARTKDLANQVCYLVSTRNAQGQSNYQEIDTFSEAIYGVLDTSEEPIVFEETIVDDLLRNPILPKMHVPDTKVQPGTLFLARYIDHAEKLRGRLWVYALDASTANTIATEHGDALGLFKLDSDAVRVELHPMTQTCVFWNAEMVQYELDKNHMYREKH